MTQRAGVAEVVCRYHENGIFIEERNEKRTVYTKKNGDRYVKINNIRHPLDANSKYDFDVEVEIKKAQRPTHPDPLVEQMLQILESKNAVIKIIQ